MSDVKLARTEVVEEPNEGRRVNRMKLADLTCTNNRYYEEQDSVDASRNMLVHILTSFAKSSFVILPSILYCDVITARVGVKSDVVAVAKKKEKNYLQRSLSKIDKILTYPCCFKSSSFLLPKQKVTHVKGFSSRTVRMPSLHKKLVYLFIKT